MQQFQESEDREDMEGDKRAIDINPNLENFTGEGNDQCIKGCSRRERRSICERTVFYPSWDGEIYPGADVP